MPSVVSISDMPAVKSSGKIKIAKTGSPLPASTAAIPSSATSVAVSNPRPKSKPTGYIFQLRSTMREQRPEESSE